MKIAMIGAGSVGKVLAARFAELGHEVSFGVREPDDSQYRGLGIKAASISVAASDAEMIVLAVPFAAAESVLAQCGDLTGKIVVDATNPLGMANGGLQLTFGFDTSGAEQIARAAGSGKFVKCFNTTGANNMAEPRGSMMFVCGDDPEACETVRRLAEAIGFAALTIGDLTRARLLEPLAMLWIHLAFTTELKRDFAFHIVRS